MRLAVVLMLAGLISPAWAQSDTVDYTLTVDRASLVSAVRDRDGKQARYVSFQFTLKSNRDGSLVLNIPKEEIVVEEDGRKVLELDLFPPQGQMLSVVLALDISGSMARGNKMEEAKRAALAFLDRMDERADVGLVLFDHEVKKDVPPLLDRDVDRLRQHREQIRTLIRDAQPTGGTAYHDATLRAAELLKRSRGRKVIVLLTDGMDTNSRASLQDAITAAQAGELPVYTVGIGQPGKNEPVTTVLVLDRSGSMLQRADDEDIVLRIDAMKMAARRFVELMRKGAKTTLLPFSDTIDIPEAFTNDHIILKDRIDRLKAFGGTLLYDATFHGIETLLAADPPGKRAVIVLTDGQDEAPGSRRSEEAVITRAKEAGIPLYMLGLGPRDEINEEVMMHMARETGGKYFHAGSQRKLIELFENLSIDLHDDGIDEESLGRLARETGGKYTHVTDLSQLSILYQQLAEELQSTYKVTFISRRATFDGTARGIDVRVVRGGRTVSTIGQADDVVRGIVVPQMSYGVYLSFLLVLVLLLGVPGLLLRLYRAFGGT
ncbi:MAG: VWA domain-containing protein [Gemmataceae bacterium]